MIAIARIERLENLFYCRDGFLGPLCDGDMATGHRPDQALRRALYSHIRSMTAAELATSIPPCATCNGAWRKRKNEVTRVEASSATTALSVLSLYAGIDGLGKGLEVGCSLLRQKWVVEQDVTACASYSKSRPEVAAYVCPVSDFVETAYAQHFNKNTTNVTRAKLENVPRPGDVDLIAGGPPCQAFSSVNLAKRVDDPRVNEPFVFLSAVDFYRPPFAIFENVRGLQDYVLPGAAWRGSMLDLITEVLLQLGYACNIGVYQAAQYGTPQARRRIMIVAARRDMPLPARPEPTHAFSPAFTTLSSRTFEGGNKHQVGVPLGDGTGEAPHAAVTFNDAVGDLPSFGFADPLRPLHEQPNERGALRAQWKEGVPIGYRDAENGPAAYATAARTSHQRLSRVSFKSDGAVTVSHNVQGHVVAPVAALTAARLSYLETPRSGHANWLGTFCCAIKSRVLS